VRDRLTYRSHIRVLLSSLMKFHRIFKISSMIGVTSGTSPRFLCRPTAFCSNCWSVGRQSALHKQNSAFAARTLSRHISTFRGYQILFSIEMIGSKAKSCCNRVQHHFLRVRWLWMNRKMVGEAIYMRVSDKKYNQIATKRGNMPTQNWIGKSAVFLMESALTSHGSSKSKKSRRTAEESRIRVEHERSPGEHEFISGFLWGSCS
jgi:hypothetical protein